MGPGREHFLNVGTLSMDERCSNGRISFTWPRVKGGSVSTARLNSLATITRSNRHAEGVSTGPPTEASTEYFDATDA